MLATVFAACGQTAPAGSADDAGATSRECSTEPNIDAVAGTALEVLRSEMTESGFIEEPLGRYELLVRGQEVQTVRESGLIAPRYFRAEHEILSLPEDDRLREAYEDGDLGSVDWGNEAMLDYWGLRPYTDTLAFVADNELVLAQLTFEACVDDHIVHGPPTRVSHLAAKVRGVDQFSHRHENHSFGLRYFEPDASWHRHEANPLLRSNAGNQTVVAVEGDVHLWAEGYSGATGMIFYGSSGDGVVWDFAWDQGHTCEFEGMPDISVHKRFPSVLHVDGTYFMWFTVTNSSLTSVHQGMYRATSTDRIHWNNIVRIHLDTVTPSISTPTIALHEGVFHLVAHTTGSTKEISHATSEDGIEWLVDPQPVIVQGDSIDDIDGFGVYQPSIAFVQGRWLMFYAAHYGAREVYQVHIMAAVSNDAQTWVRHPMPVLSQQLDPGGWESGQANLGSPTAVPRGDEIWLYYTGVEGGEPSVGLATARDWQPAMTGP